MQNYKFIYLLGPEGVGKTTTANHLRCYIAKKKKGAIITEVRSTHLYSYIIWSLLIRLGRVEYYNYPDGTRIPRIDRWYLRRIIRPWLLIEFTSIIISIFFKVFLPSLLGCVVICTRYVIDSAVNLLAYTLVAPRGLPLIYRVILPTLLRLIPKGGLLIYLDANYEKLVCRYRERGSYTEPLNWIDFYRRLTRKMVSSLPNHKAIFITTDSMSRRDVLKAILKEMI